MSSSITCLVVLAVLGSSWAQNSGNFDCKGKQDSFIHWWACGSYGICRSGRYEQVDCLNGTSYDRRKRDCVITTTGVSFPCDGKAHRCEGYPGPGHRFADDRADPVEGLPACSFYYTCSYGRYLKHQQCNAGTVYHEGQQRCLPSSQVPDPCGSFVEEPDFQIGQQALQGNDIPDTDYSWRG